MRNGENNEQENHQNDDHKIEITLQGQTDEFSIKIETKTTIFQLSSTIDKITENILKSKSFSKDRLTSTETVVKNSVSPSIESNSITETPVRLFAMKLGIDADKFEKSKLVGIRDKDIQIIKTSQISALEDGMLILAIKDLLMNEKHLPYDDWKELCDANGIKSKTPFYKVATNAKRGGYLYKSKHANKELLLTPKGIEFVKSAVENFLNK